MDRQPTVVITESKYDIAKFLEVALSCHGYHVEVLRNGTEAITYLTGANGRISVALVDVHLPGKDGIETLVELRGAGATLPVVMYSSEASPAMERRAREQGASDFISLPINHAELVRVVGRQIQGGGFGQERDLKAQAAGSEVDAFLCVNPRMQAIRATMRRLALSNVPVVFHGESGVGKEILARALHMQSNRAAKPFVKLNCAAVPSELLESELFGYERGAFTGAFKSTAGKFEQAEGGTILLDEIGDMELKLQAKLLHVLQDREFQRLGGRDTVRVNVRVLVATHRNLEAEILAGRFRSDLYYRLNVIRVDIPSLRERTDEILPFVELFVRKHSAPRARPQQIPSSFTHALMAYDWPGNIRELENVVQRFLVLQNPELIAEELRAGMRLRQMHATSQAVTALTGGIHVQSQGELPAFEKVNETKAQIEAEVIRAALDLMHWNRKKAAERLMMDYKALLYKMKKLEITPQKPKAAHKTTAA
jgi:two-component system response regulator AtoC